MRSLVTFLKNFNDMRMDTARCPDQVAPVRLGCGRKTSCPSSRLLTEAESAPHEREDLGDRSNVTPPQTAKAEHTHYSGRHTHTVTHSYTLTSLYTHHYT